MRDLNQARQAGRPGAGGKERRMLINQHFTTSDAPSQDPFGYVIRSGRKLATFCFVPIVFSTPQAARLWKRKHGKRGRVLPIWTRADADKLPGGEWVMLRGCR